MTKELCASITTATSGKLILREYFHGETKETIFDSRKTLCDYINPQVAIPAPPPFPSNQANLGQMNINALHAQPINNASTQNDLLNSLLANKQFNMSSPYPGANGLDALKGQKIGALSTQDQFELGKTLKQGAIDQAFIDAGYPDGEPKSGDSSKQQEKKDFKNRFVIEEQSKGTYKITHQKGDCEPYIATVAGLSQAWLAQQVCNELQYRLNLPDHCQHFYQKMDKPDKEPIIDGPTRALIHLATQSGYAGRLNEFICHVKALKVQANLHDDKE